MSSILEQRIRGVQEEAGLAETGRVLSVGYVVVQRSRWENGRAEHDWGCALVTVSLEFME